MNVPWESLLPFLAALKRQPSALSPQDEDDSDPAADQFDGPGPASAPAGDNATAQSNGAPSGAALGSGTPQTLSPPVNPDPAQGGGKRTPQQAPPAQPGQNQPGPGTTGPANPQGGGQGTRQPLNQDGSRDVIVPVWDAQGTSVGHSAAFELNGQPILSQFPKCWPTERCTIGPNQRLDWNDTLKKEGRAPDHVFQVHIPNGQGFDGTAQNHHDRSTWNWYPTRIEPWETNCVYSVGKSLQAGGVPVDDHDLPGFLADDLEGKSKVTGQPWNVKKLPNVPWQPPAPAKK